MVRTLLSRLSLGLILVVPTCLSAHAVEETSADIIAVQIREQGYACDKALSAKREHPESDDAVRHLAAQLALASTKLGVSSLQP